MLKWLKFNQSDFQFSIFNFQFSIFNFQFSIFNFQFSIFNFQFSIFKRLSADLADCQVFFKVFTAMPVLKNT
ncbi:hypothetical protein E6P74_11090 [Moraxella lacunata]|nr:hypothetical protein [Moraxella lacunata]